MTDAPPSADQPTVFVVDDDAAICASIAKLVQEMGIRTKVFNSGESFLESLTDISFGCAVIDVRLLGMNGLQLLKEIKDRGCNLETVILTGYADVRMAVDAIKSGASMFLEKPYRTHELWDAIMNAIQQSKMRFEQTQSRQSHRKLINDLSPQEIDLLSDLVSSTPMKAIAAKLNYSIRTIWLRRQKLFEHFGVKTTVELANLLKDLDFQEYISERQRQP